MPSRLRPTAPLATDAILVGDPGRSLLLAQELLEKPKMSNHARGLWGYSGRTASGLALTIQATGMGGPSAAVVLADLAKLGVKRAIRVGTCSGLPGRAELGELLLPAEVVAEAGSTASLGPEPGATLAPDPALFERLGNQLTGAARVAPVTSLDTLHGDRPPPGAVEVVAADMQTAAVLARAEALGLAAAAVLVVSTVEEMTLDDEALAQRAAQAGRAAAEALSNP